MSFPEKPVLEPVDQPWSTALVLVCSECEGGHGVELTHKLKDAVKESGHKKDVRVARVRCLGICPKKGVAVTITGAGRAPQSCVVTGKDHAAVPALLAAILPR
jgi:hypothetical protein